MILSKCWSRPSKQHVIAKENVHKLHIYGTQWKKLVITCVETFLSRKSPGLNRINSHLSSILRQTYVILTFNTDNCIKYSK